MFNLMVALIAQDTTPVKNLAGHWRTEHNKKKQRENTKV